MDASAKPLLTRRRAAAGALAMGLAGVSGVVVAVYLQREAIGVRFALDFLRAHGVPADIRLDRLDLNGASGSMRLGPWWRPDLTVPHMEMAFKALPASAKGLAAPQVRSLDLTQPTLHGRWKDGRLEFGTLQPLIDQALHAKPSGAPPPDLDIHDGRLLLDTPGGRLVIALDASARGGRLRSIHARLEPVDLTVAGVRLAAAQGVLSGQPDGADHLHLNAAFGAARGHGQGTAASGLTLNLEAVAPNGAPSAQASARQGRPLDATVRVQVGRLSLQPRKDGPIRVQGADLTLDLDGAVDAANRFSGRLRAAGRAQALEDARGGVRAVSLELKSAEAQAGATDGRVMAQGPFTLDIAAAGGRLATPDGAATLGGSHLTASGRAMLGRGLQLQAQGAVQTEAGLDRPDAERLGRQFAGSFDPAAAAALAGALQHARLQAPIYQIDYDTLHGGGLRLPRGADVTLANGAVRLRPIGNAAVVQAGATGAISGALNLSARLAGLPQLDLSASRYRLERDGSATAQVKLALKGGLGPVQGASLSASATVLGRRGTWQVASDGCADADAGSVRSGSQVVASGLRARLCPVPDAPLAIIEPTGWRVRGRVQDATFALPGPAFKGQLAVAEVTMAGGRLPPAGQVTLQRLVLQDTSSAPRVGPLSVDGGASLSGGAAEGRLRVALANKGVTLGTLQVQARLDTGAGDASFVGDPLRFDPKGLQAGDIAPAAAHALPQAEGALQVSAHASWTHAGIAASSAEVQTEGLSFKSPAGRIDGVSGDLKFSSLAPLRSAGVQSVAADKLETLLPLTGLKASFALLSGGLDLQSASAGAAGGEVRLDPMQVALTPGGGATSGVLRLKGVDVQNLISAFNLSNAVAIQAKIDGELPFALQPATATGGALHLGPGRVYAEGPGRLTIARQALGAAVTTAGAAGAQPNAVQDFAYQALENLAFTKLEASVASRPAGRLGVVFHIVGRHDPKLDQPTRIGVFQFLRGHAFDKPLPLPKGTPVDLTLDTSLNLDDLLAAYGALNASPGSAKVQP